MRLALSDQLFISAHCGDEIAARPEMLIHEVSLALSVMSRNVDRTFPLDVSCKSILLHLLALKVRRYLAADYLPTLFMVPVSRGLDFNLADCNRSLTESPQALCLYVVVFDREGRG